MEEFKYSWFVVDGFQKTDLDGRVVSGGGSGNELLSVQICFGGPVSCSTFLAWFGCHGIRDEDVTVGG